MPKQNLIIKASAIHLLCCVLLINGEAQDDSCSEEAARAYLNKIDKDIQVKTTESTLASWAYESNITDENLRHQLEASAKLANFTKEIWKETIKFPWKTFRDPDIKRRFQKFSVLGIAILSPEKYEKYNKIISDMNAIYGKAKICNYHNRTDCSLQLEPELTEIFTSSRDPEELRYYWEQWRNAAGKPVRQMYKEYVDLVNEAAVLNNFTNNAEFWLRDYEAPDFKEQVENLWEQLRPLYLQLHAYVRRRLREQYGEQNVPKRGPIPAHLLGNMWAQSWHNTYNLTVPYPNKASTDVTPNMVQQGYTPLRMFKLAEQFFTSLDLSPMPECFWKNSILEKPNDGRDLICHASAWDFYDGKDFRIKQCTRITMEDLNTAHHEMGHIQYFLQYKNQPLVYKEGSNPGFHEAVGDVMALSVSTPKHLRKIGLLNAGEDDAESEINQLFAMALDKIAFIPFGYLMDQWRWGVFEGKIPESEYNCKWWELREKYQGLSPSVSRSEADFDPGAKYHVVASVPYIRYFVSFVIQFQFHRSLCIAAKEYDPNNPASKPLHKCDIYQSKEAGALLKEMLQMGSSKPWPDAMQVITGQCNMDARPLLEYFATLQDWLEKENKRTNEHIGWDASSEACEVENNSETVTPRLTPQGKFEDDNIAYSYAEFVRQDDNAFGVGDYTEESAPSYFVLPQSIKSKESGLRGFTLLWKTPKGDNENEKFYIPENSHLENENNFAVSFKRQNKENRAEQLKSNEMFDDGNSCPYCQRASYPWSDTVFDFDGKNEQTSNLQLNENDQVLIKRGKNERADEKIYNAGKEEIFADAGILGERLEGIDDRRKTILPLIDSKNNIKKNDYELLLKKGIDEEINDKEQNKVTWCEPSSGDNQAQTNCVLETLRKYEKLNLRPNNELIRKAEAVKSQAVEMLQNLNTSKMLMTASPIQVEDKVIHNACDNRSTDMNTVGKFSRTKLNELDRISTLRGMLKQNLQKNSGLSKADVPKKPVHEMELNTPCHEKAIKDHDSESGLANILSRKKQKKIQNPHDDQRNLHKKNYENRNNYVMLIGKLSENDKFSKGKKKIRKKSYREFSSKIKTPVVYNAVVITANGKGEKMEDTKPLALSDLSNGLSGSVKRQPVKFSRRRYVDGTQRKREIRQNIMRNGFYNPGKSYQYNIRNRLQ